MAKAKKVAVSEEQESKESILKNLTNLAEINGTTLDAMVEGDHLSAHDKALYERATGKK